jgi:6-pyruvoyl-tetrahydropterin synthase
MDVEPLGPAGLRLLVLPLTMAASLTRTVGFRASHRLYRPEWSESRYRQVFETVGDAPGHSHDYECAVTVVGDSTRWG